MQEDTKKEVGGNGEADQPMDIANETMNEHRDSEKKDTSSTLPEGSGQAKEAEPLQMGLQGEQINVAAEPEGATETRPPKPVQPSQLSIRAYLESTGKNACQGVS